MQVGTGLNSTAAPANGRWNCQHRPGHRLFGKESTFSAVHGGCTALLTQNNDKQKNKQKRKKITSIPRNQSVNKYIRRTRAYTYMSTTSLHRSIGIKGVKPVRNSGNTERNNQIVWDQNTSHDFCPFRGAQLLSRECYRYVRLDTVNHLIVRPRSLIRVCTLGSRRGNLLIYKHLKFFLL